ncbi:MAG: D-Ala-D-Ala carboxypeptidase family metallohydrolase [Dehalococcoidales bacterium]|nr:D-Ala-D-Ala carboxypeptidase family metallohydrolase [Dehalococcoidales bacterium]
MYKPFPKPMTTAEKKAKYPLKLTKNFSLWEAVCPCCGFYIIDPRFLRKLQALRTRIGKAVTVNSWYRCNNHNSSLEGSSENSYHQYGMAADIKVAGMRPEVLAAHARAVGLYVIIYSWGCHVDDRNG